jgi:septal ring factor EnvC (AmiA/AmiB activator)
MIILRLFTSKLFCQCCWQARSKTDGARTKAAQEAFRELQSARQEALQRKKAEKKKLLEEVDAKLSAEALRRKEEKERARQMKKSGPKVKMLRS